MILGVDPGNSGAVAWLDENGGLVKIEDMPVTTMRVGRANKNRLSPGMLSALLVTPFPGAAWVEEVHAMPKQGVSSSFNFGYSFGVIHGTLAAHGYAVEPIQPPVWRKLAGVRGGKDGSRHRAAQLYPARADLFARKKDDGRAEAVLIAYAGWLTANTKVAR